MKNITLKVLIPCILALTLASCGAKDAPATGSSNDSSQEQNSNKNEDNSTSSKVVNLKSQEEFKTYSAENISSYKKIFEKNNITYRLSTDSSIIMNDKNSYSSLGKEYSTFFSVSVGANVNLGKADTIATSFITSHIDDKFSKDNDNYALAFDLLSSTNSSYKDVNKFIEDLNTAVSSMTSDTDKKIIEDTDTTKIKLIKDRNVIKLFIISSSSADLSYGKIKPMEFAKYDDYKKLMTTTNAEIYDKEIKKSPVFLGSTPTEKDGLRILDYTTTFGKKDNTENYEYNYGITNAQNLDLSSGDFKISLSLSCDVELERLASICENFTDVLSEKFNLKINAKDLENYLVSNLELHTFMNKYVNSNLEADVLKFYSGSKRFISNGLPFEGMTSSSSFGEKKINARLQIDIPAIVEGKERR